MVDQITTSQTCSMCGAALTDVEFQMNGLCSRCAGYNASEPPSVAEATVQSSDPDHPRWGPGTGIGVWIASVAAVVVIPAIALFAWYLIEGARGVEVPPLTINGELNAEFLKWGLLPNAVLVQIGSTIVAHAMTLALCWAIVTGVGARPFRQSLGWSWGGHPIWYWVVFSACLLVAIELLALVLLRFLPQTQSPFDQMLKTSQEVRIAVALLATFTAPTVEEIVYRGVLFSALRSRIGLTGTVLVVTVTFAGVHVLQNVGAWVSMIGLTLLSLALTMVRARTKSVLPCIAIHTLNNAFASVLILLNKGS